MLYTCRNSGFGYSLRFRTSDVLAATFYPSHFPTIEGTASLVTRAADFQHLHETYQHTTPVIFGRPYVVPFRTSIHMSIYSSCIQELLKHTNSQT